MSDVANTISSLHTQLIDAANGYAEAQELAKHDPVATLCADLRKTHETHAHELAEVLQQHGVEPDEDGSYMSLVHKTVLNVRFAFTSDESNLLPGIRDGEERIASSYEDAVRAAEQPGSDLAPHAGVLARQRQVVLEHISRIGSLEAAT